VTAFSTLLAAAGPCEQQNAADQMIDLAKQLNDDAQMIKLAQIFRQQPRNTVSAIYSIRVISSLKTVISRVRKAFNTANKHQRTLNCRDCSNVNSLAPRLRRLLVAFQPEVRERSPWGFLPP
jgi:hypothetical protein